MQEETAIALEDSSVFRKEDLSFHLFQPGYRANLASADDLKAALTTGYFELECLMNGQIAHRRVRKAGNVYVFGIYPAGEHGVRLQASYQNIEQLRNAVDFTAYRWYPFLPSP